MRSLFKRYNELNEKVVHEKTTIEEKALNKKTKEKIIKLLIEIYYLDQLTKSIFILLIKLFFSSPLSILPESFNFCEFTFAINYYFIMQVRAVDKPVEPT